VNIDEPEHPSLGHIVALVNQPGNLAVNFDLGGGGILVESPDLRDRCVLEAVVDLIDQIEVVPGTSHLGIIDQQPIPHGQHIEGFQIDLGNALWKISQQCICRLYQALSVTEVAFFHLGSCGEDGLV